MEKPILFSGEMVRAILDGRKTQTRRVIKPQPAGNFIGWAVDSTSRSIKPGDALFSQADPLAYRRCPYGRPDDTLWVRETWAEFPEGRIIYRATDLHQPLKWRPSIFMPRWASRLTLRVVNVRVERVQQIEPRDCVAEGVYNAGSLSSNTMYREAFAALWDSINAKRGYSWDSNPWVWVVDFEVVK